MAAHNKKYYWLRLYDDFFTSKRIKRLRQIAVAIPIYYATKSKGKALLYATLSGFSELLGALLCMAVTAVFGVDLSAGGPAFPLILAAVSGIMIYISLDELLPTAEKYGKHHIAIAGVISGMAIMGISLLII